MSISSFQMLPGQVVNPFACPTIDIGSPSNPVIVPINLTGLKDPISLELLSERIDTQLRDNLHFILVTISEVENRPCLHHFEAKNLHAHFETSLAPLPNLCNHKKIEAIFYHTMNKNRTFSRLLCVENPVRPEEVAFLKAYLNANEQGSIGQSESMWEVCKHYRLGKVVEKDLTIAFEWFKKAARHGHAEAQYKVGCLHEELATGPALEEAKKWLEKAAEQGHVKAQYILGYLYKSGRLATGRDLEQAKKWFEKAAKQGHLAAQFSLVNLGLLYEDGHLAAGPDVEKARAGYEKKVKEIASTKIRPQQAPSEKKEMPQEEPQKEIPKNICCQGMQFKISYEVTLGMAHMRTSDHFVEVGVLTKCLGKRRKKFRKQLQRQEASTMDLYFQGKGSQTLNIVVKYFPQEEIPFVVWTAYYMPPHAVKGRRQIDQARFEDWFRKLPTSY